MNRREGERREASLKKEEEHNKQNRQEKINAVELILLYLGNTISSTTFHMEMNYYFEEDTHCPTPSCARVFFSM